MSMEQDVFHLDGLDAIVKALKVSKPPVIHLGILGTNERSAEEGEKVTTNATVGAAHEFGTTRLPQRSFLRAPIINHLLAALENSGAFDKAALAQVMAEKSLRPWTERAAVVALGVVQEAFATGGYGQWTPHAPGYTNNANQILVDTTQLRDSITYEVVE